MSSLHHATISTPQNSRYQWRQAPKWARFGATREERRCRQTRGPSRARSGPNSYADHRIRGAQPSAPDLYYNHILQSRASPPSKASLSLCWEPVAPFLPPSSLEFCTPKALTQFERTVVSRSPSDYPTLSPLCLSSPPKRLCPETPVSEPNKLQTSRCRPLSRIILIFRIARQP